MVAMFVGYGVSWEEEFQVDSSTGVTPFKFKCFRISENAYPIGFSYKSKYTVREKKQNKQESAGIYTQNS